MTADRDDFVGTMDRFAAALRRGMTPGHFIECGVQDGRECDCDWSAFHYDDAAAAAEGGTP